jgi:hypothetical protein
VVDRKNILISGASGSPKTTLRNALAGFIPGNQRIVLIENPVELELDQASVVRWEARDSVSPRQLLEQVLRHHPNRLIVGEIKGRRGWSSGRCSTPATPVRSPRFTPKRQGRARAIHHLRAAGGRGPAFAGSAGRG